MFPFTATFTVNYQRNNQNLVGNRNKKTEAANMNCVILCPTGNPQLLTTVKIMPKDLRHWSDEEREVLLSPTLHALCGMSLWLRGYFSAGDRFPLLSLISSVLSIALDAGNKTKKAPPSSSLMILCLQSNNGGENKASSTSCRINHEGGERGA